MRAPRAARGMVLIGVVFLILVLLGLGVAVSNLSGAQADTQAKSLLAAKAYYGARAGLEWGIQRAVAGGSCAASTTFALTQGALNGASVTVTCTASTFTGSNTVYRLTSIATLGTLGQLNYAERRLSAAVSNIP